MLVFSGNACPYGMSAKCLVFQMLHPNWRNTLERNAKMSDEIPRIWPVMPKPPHTGGIISRSVCFRVAFSATLIVCFKTADKP